MHRLSDIICIYVTYRVFLGVLITFFTCAHALWHATSVQMHLWLHCHDVTLWDDVTWNTGDVMSWLHHDITRLYHDVMGEAYKRCCAVPLRVHFGSDSLTVHLGTCACLDRHADMPVFLEPTSFKCIQLGCCYYCERPRCNDAFEHSDTSCENCFDFSTCHLHRTIILSVGAHKHCSWHRRSTS